MLVALNACTQWVTGMCISIMNKALSLWRFQKTIYVMLVTRKDEWTRQVLSYIVNPFVLKMLGIFNNKMPSTALYNKDVLSIVERTSAKNR